MRKQKLFPTRLGSKNTLIDSLNQRADAHNEFVDVCERRFEWFKDGFDLLLDYLWKKDKAQRKTDWFLLWLSIFNLIATGTMLWLILNGII